MDHEDVREHLELAAAEPAGIDRLMAGDTPLAASIAAHLAGCPSCTDELDRLRRASIVIGDAIRTTPPPELRERTLRLVREMGRVRRAPERPMPAPAAATGAPPRWPRPLAWIAAIVAAVVLAVAGTALVLDRQTSNRLAEAQYQLAGLSRVTAATAALSNEPDAQHVALDGEDDLWGRLVYSPGTAEVAVIASGLSEPAGDREYRCWVEVDGTRRPVGKMHFGGDLAYWAGPVDAIADLPEEATFGVSLVDAAGTDLSGPAVLAGTTAE